MKQIIDAQVAFGTAVLKYDLLTGVTGKRESAGRRLIGIGLGGGAVSGDCGADLVVNSIAVASLLNRAITVPTKDHILPCNIIIPGDAELIVEVTDVAPSGFMACTLIFG